MNKFQIACISFDHMHAGDLLRMVDEHPDAQIAGVFDPDRSKMAAAIEAFGIPEQKVFTDFDQCMTSTKPDLALVCAATADHADYVERLAKHDCHVFVEKPFAASVADARRMMKAMENTNRLMAINWPLAWVESHVTAKRLIDEGMIGELREIHFYDGNRGPLYHVADKIEVSPEVVEKQKPDSWWYKKASGGGSLLDYMGYGATLGTWYKDGEAPIEVTCIVDETPGIEVDQHAIAVCRYATGLSKMETRWGTFTDPWSIQPQPKCGFVFIGRDGTIASWDYAQELTLQTRDNPEPHPIACDVLSEGKRNGIEYVLSCIHNGNPIEGPLNPNLCLTAQRIVDTAVLSAQARRTMELVQ